MQRRAQRDQRAPRAQRLTRLLVCAAAVPAMLAAAGCSSDSGSSDDAGKKAAETSAPTSASPTPTVEPAAYRTLPKSCATLPKKTLKDLVPGGESGKEGTSDDTAVRASCSWDSLDDNGVKGSQYRWLNVSMLRFDSDTSRGAGDKRAHERYLKQVADTKATEGAKALKAEPFTGTGDEATLVRYDLKKKEGAFKQQTVVARAENVVVSVDYNGAGLAGDKAPDADALAKAARKAATEAITAVQTANGGADGKGSPSGSPSAKAPSAKSPSAKTSAKTSA
ncbi:DUF3558 family protein [Streptomyces sp. NPDC003717]|uniref:DUF3558 family protein n=1 Tax=Streptomyces sp. NPDC003717 TaxID=3154276 RepID=UPI0033A7A68F